MEAVGTGVPEGDEEEEEKQKFLTLRLDTVDCKSLMSIEFPSWMSCLKEEKVNQGRNNG